MTSQTSIKVKRLHYGKYQWRVLDDYGIMIGFGSNDTRDGARQDAKDCSTAWKKSVREMNNNRRAKAKGRRWGWAY